MSKSKCKSKIKADSRLIEARGLMLRATEIRNLQYAEWCRLRLAPASSANFLKMNVTWYLILVDFKIPNKIQPQEYSRGSGIDGIRYILRGSIRMVTPTSRSSTPTATSTSTGLTMIRTTTGAGSSQQLPFIPRLTISGVYFSIYLLLPAAEHFAYFHG